MGNLKNNLVVFYFFYREKFNDFSEKRFQLILW